MTTRPPEQSVHTPSRAPSLEQAPALTLPPDEAAFLRQGYAGANVILEYGSGGSTALAAAMPGKTVWSVESDKDWLEGLRDWFDRNPPKSQLHLVHGDVGPTREWGMPVNRRFSMQFHHYPLAVWDMAGFMQPDVVLIDGRFRMGCFLAVAFRTQKPVTVYFDDYKNRVRYHGAERFGPPAEMVGRMARFELTPQSVAGADLVWIMDMFAQMR